MCGLALAFSKRGRGVGKQVYEMYKAQESRGKEGFGYISIQDGKLVAVERAQKEEGIKNKLLADKSEIILFHHRMPTSTKNTIGTTHPIFVSNPELEYDYYVAHNGVITNDDNLKAIHEKLGYVYTTEFTEHIVAKYKNGVTEELDADRPVFNDSECLAIELARYIEGLSNSVDTKGSAAFWVVQLEKASNKVLNIFYGKNKGRDLKITHNKKWWGVSSETGTDIESMKLYSFDFGDKTLYEQPLNIDESYKVVKVGYQTTRYAYEDNTHYNRSDVAYGAEKQADIHAYDSLANAYYSMKEAADTGVPLGEFTRTIFAGYYYYVPNKFIGKDFAERQLFSEWPFNSVIALPTPSTVNTDEKAQFRLEELCNEYAEKQCQQEKYQSLNDKGVFTAVAFKKLSDAIELEMQELEEQISALGFDTEQVEEVMDIAKDLADYNHSFDSYNETEVIQFS